MPKLKNVTAADLQAELLAATDLQAVVRDYTGRMEQGYVDDIPEPVAVASGFLAVSRSLADMAAALLTKAALQEQKAELETLLRKQRDGDKHGLKNERTG